ncbi:hypothetical protein ACH4YO_24215 [Streptomyces noursei]|uniref:hypothetical protein n=1 Tax=Streptomyces noursei TaxID=1971 RepID=UPI00081CC3AB|nr:hypothetical protein SNOUR_19430 [Streptomyces noursei ATCC 11455]MCZ0994127.1 hypothetical protein [Streptomyces noursei]
MYVSIVLWNLKNSKATVEDLREYLRDYAVDAFSTLKGMRMKTWFADAERGYWGAVYLWDGVNMQNPLSVSRAIDIIGYPPTSTSVFAVEAIAEGDSVIESFAGIGRAFEEASTTDPVGESA